VDPGWTWCDTAVESLAAGILEQRFDRMSQGMQRRLALALAFSGFPELVILDEPYNGLDPSGMASLRELVGEAAGRGACVVVSSHYLDAMEDLATRLVLLDRGRVRLDRRVAAAARDRVLAIRTSKDSRASLVLTRGGFRVSENEVDGGLRVRVLGDMETAECVSLLVAAGFGVYEVQLRAPSLSDIVLSTLGKLKKTPEEVG
jgi:ABC-2 type transport system ATP-binding protein